MLLSLLLLAWAGASHAAQLVSEGVTFAGGLYTYHYAVDNRAGTDTVIEVSVLVIPIAQISTLPPLPHTSPPGWTFVTSFGGPNPPTGTFQAWQTSTGVPPGQYLSGFSFTTAYAPSPTTTPNYFLFREPTGAFDLGIVDAPVLSASVPLMGGTAAVVLLLSLVAIAVLRLRI